MLGYIEKGKQVEENKVKSVFNLANRIGGIAYCYKKQNNLVGMGIYDVKVNERLVIEEGDSIEYCNKMLPLSIKGYFDLNPKKRLVVMGKEVDKDLLYTNSDSTDWLYEELSKELTTDGILENMDSRLTSYCRDNGIILKVCACVGSYSINIIAKSYKVNYFSNVVVGRTLQEACDNALLFIEDEEPKGCYHYEVCVLSQHDLKQKSDTLGFFDYVDDSQYGMQDRIDNIIGNKKKEKLDDVKPFLEFVKNNFDREVYEKAKEHQDSVHWAIKRNDEDEFEERKGIHYWYNQRIKYLSLK